MYLKELKQFINNLSDDFDEYIVVNGEIAKITPNKDNNFKEEVYYRVNNPIITLYIDEEEKTLNLFHQTEEDVKELLKTDINDAPGTN